MPQSGYKLIYTPCVLEESLVLCPRIPRICPKNYRRRLQASPFSFKQNAKPCAHPFHSNKNGSDNCRPTPGRFVPIKWSPLLATYFFFFPFRAPLYETQLCIITRLQQKTKVSCTPLNIANVFA